MKALEDLFPGFDQDLARAGGIPVDPMFDLLFELPGKPPFPRRKLNKTIYGMSRPLLELVIRRRLEQRGNTILRGRSIVGKILGVSDGSAATGVEYKAPNGTPEMLSADLIVDASGSGLPTLAFLKSAGRSLPEETTLGIDIRYSSALFAIPPGSSDYKQIITIPKAPEHVRYGYVLLAENNTSQVLMVGRGDDIPPVDDAAFLEYARELETPTIYNAIKNAERLSEIARFAFPESVWRHYGKLPDFPRGLLPLGDAIARFNPVRGQGMAVGLVEAAMLQQAFRAYASEANPIADAGQAFLAKAESFLADPWAMSTTPDFIYPQTRGERPPDLKDKLIFEGALNRLAARDPAAHRLMVEVAHLLKPRSVLNEPGLVRQIEQEMAAA
jgi:2-polyprenyl-6-methoxyphenol hydroxylase-like FAD-dependent oxidoreductase